MGNCYKTIEEAKEALEIKKIDTELRRYAIEHNEEEIDWEDADTAKYIIFWDNSEKGLTIEDYYYFKFPNQIYFTDYEIAEAAIEAIGKDRVEKWAKA